MKGLFISHMFNDILQYRALSNLEKEQSIDRIAFAHNLCDVQIRKVHQP